MRVVNSVPKIAKDLCWTIENDMVNIIMITKGTMNFLLQKIMRKPKKSIIHLDEIGSFIWKKIDGNKTTDEIAQELEKKFGKNAAPVRQRLEKYFKTLCEYKFISLNKI